MELDEFGGFANKKTCCKNRRLSCVSGAEGQNRIADTAICQSLEGILADDGFQVISCLEAESFFEFVRHKILDLIGDLYLLGHPIRGRLYVNMTSHQHNQALIQKIYCQLNGNTALRPQSK